MMTLTQDEFVSETGRRKPGFCMKCRQNQARGKPELLVRVRDGPEKLGSAIIGVKRAGGPFLLSFHFFSVAAARSAPSKSASLYQLSPAEAEVQARINEAQRASEARVREAEARMREEGAPPPTEPIG